jgi:2-succinyl-5-enolpyruvyl-6-hydroxy-3-cyclohexene-1-carboxylate synthase
VIAPAIHQLAALCSAKGIEQVFLRSGKFTCYTISDERSAAFIALGLAQQSRKPVVVVCTSGSAAYNLAPAVAEAFFQHVPLIVITADRPHEWIDQLDGQTIRQQNLYGGHVKRFAELPHDYAHADATWYANRVTNEMINLALEFPQGPVHLNAPFREPLYPSIAEKDMTAQQPRVIEHTPAVGSLGEPVWEEILKKVNQYRKILVVSGQRIPDPGSESALGSFFRQHRWPLAGDILSNLHTIPGFCGHADTFLGQLPEKLKVTLKPDLVITMGQSLVAKNLKVFLRQFAPQEHWHLQPGGAVADTFQNLTRILRIDPSTFFAELNRRAPEQQVAHRVYGEEWQQHELQARNSVQDFFAKHDQGEFAFVNHLLHSLPDRCNLHLANSMSVRYANHVGLLENQKGIQVYSNRGTSGIDGCTSTAAGHALASQVPNVLLTGDQAFFYDRNAFWHNYPLQNLYVVVLNNHGGIIFNLIDGPAGLPEGEEYFITRQPLRAKALAQEFGYTYSEGINPSWKDFFQPGNDVKIHEVETSQSMNKSAFEAFRKYIKKSYEA